MRKRYGRLTGFTRSSLFKWTIFMIAAFLFINSLYIGKTYANAKLEEKAVEIVKANAPYIKEIGYDRLRAAETDFNFLKNTFVYDLNMGYMPPAYRYIVMFFKDGSYLFFDNSLHKENCSINKQDLSKILQVNKQLIDENNLDNLIELILHLYGGAECINNIDLPLKVYNDISSKNELTRLKSEIKKPQWYIRGKNIIVEFYSISFSKNTLIKWCFVFDGKSSKLISFNPLILLDHKKLIDDLTVY